MVLVSSAVSGFAWDDVGHKISAYIAWQQMTPAARDRAIKILLAAPEDSHLSALYVNDSRDLAVKQRNLFMITAYWADIVRDRNFPVRSQKYSHGTWHYKDSFWKEVNGGIESVPVTEGGTENSIERLEVLSGVLGNASKSDAEKAIALAWFLHLGGDTHQPLHCAARVTDKEPKGDQGGNLFLLEPKDPNKPLTENLHWYWDSIIRGYEPRTADDADCDDAYLIELANKMMKKFPAAKAGDMKLGQFEQWRLEGYEIATKQVYVGLTREQKPSKKYQKWAYGVGQQRLTLAGYRMGTMLNQLLGQ